MFTMPTQRRRRLKRFPSTTASKSRRDDYELYRNRMEHEDTLVGQRVTWLVSSQAFLLTPYVLLYTKTVDTINDTVSSSSGIPMDLSLSYLALLTLATYVVIYIGVLSCLIPFRSTAAAIESMCELTYDFLLAHQPSSEYEPGIHAARKEGIKGLYAPRHLPLLSAGGWAVLSFIPSITFGRLLTMHQVVPNQEYWTWYSVFLLLLAGCLLLVGWVFLESRREVQNSNRIIGFIKALDVDVPGVAIEPSDSGCRVTAGIVPWGPYGLLPDGVDGCEIVQERSGAIVTRFENHKCTIKDVQIGDAIRARYIYNNPRPEQNYLKGPWSAEITVTSTAPATFSKQLLRPSKVRYSPTLDLQ